MTSTSRKPSSRRYSWVVSPRTPIDGDRSRTALANALTASSNGRTAPGSCDRANWTPTPRTVTGIVSRSMTRVRRMRLSMYDAPEGVRERDHVGVEALVDPVGTEAVGGQSIRRDLASPFVLRIFHAVSRNSRFPLLLAIRLSRSIRSAETASNGLLVPRMRIFGHGPEDTGRDRPLAHRLEDRAELAQDPRGRAPDREAVDVVGAVAQRPVADRPLDDLDRGAGQEPLDVRLDDAGDLVR